MHHWCLIVKHEIFAKETYGKLQQQMASLTVAPELCVFFRSKPYTTDIRKYKKLYHQPNFFVDKSFGAFRIMG